MEEIRQSCLRTCIKPGGCSRSYTRRCSRLSHHPSGVAAVHASADRHELSRHVHQKDHAFVQPVPKGSAEDTHQQFFRTYDRFNALTFVAHLKEPQKHFGKAVLICDRAPQHRSRLVREFLRKNKNVKIMYFPKGTPYLNAVEECWRQGKHRLLVFEYYRTFSDMCLVISTYYRTAWFNLELIKYANKKTELIHANL